MVQVVFGGQKCDFNGLISVVGVGWLVGEIIMIDLILIVQCILVDIQIIVGFNVVFFVFNLIFLFLFDGGYIFGVVWEVLCC